jgi:ABC-type lipoprotein export system ATPase subunit
MSDVLYLLKGLGKEYKTASEQITVLSQIDLEIKQGDSIAILGTSGSGKSTLLHILGTLDLPSWGEITFKDFDLKSIDDKEKANLANLNPDAYVLFSKNGFSSELKALKGDEVQLFSVKNLQNLIKREAK